jgi:hypothetical protein
MYEVDKPSKRKQHSLTVWHPLAMQIKTNGQRRGELDHSLCGKGLSSFSFLRLEDEIARMKKNQERRLHRKNAKIVKEGGTPMQLNRPVKPDTTVRHLASRSTFFHTNGKQRRCGHCGQMGHMSALNFVYLSSFVLTFM